MSREVRVHFVPALFQPDELRGCVAVVIDVLRASTTIVHALAAGANSIVPCEEVDEARRLATVRASEQVVLGGERAGILIEGFDLDNSPHSYTADRVGGRTVVFTTTNGTRALARCRLADRVYVGTFVNLNAAIDVLLRQDGPIHVVCAGTDRRPTSEDILCAGALVSGLAQETDVDAVGDDQARIAGDLFGLHRRSREELYSAVCRSRGGRNLLARQFDRDVERATTWDLFQIVPEYNADSGEIRPASGVPEHPTVRVPAPAG